MARLAKTGTEARTPLSRERVLRAAVTFADEGGIGSLSMILEGLERARDTSPP